MKTLLKIIVLCLLIILPSLAFAGANKSYIPFPILDSSGTTPFPRASYVLLYFDENETPTLLFPSGTTAQVGVSPFVTPLVVCGVNEVWVDDGTGTMSCAAQSGGGTTGVTFYGTDGSVVKGASGVTDVPVLTGTSSTVVSDGVGGVTRYIPLLALDEDSMASDSDTNLATQQSIKSYHDDGISGMTTYVDDSISAVSTFVIDTSGQTLYGLDGSVVTNVSGVTFVPAVGGTSSTVISDGRGGATYYYGDLDSGGGGGQD
ncbi:hypothetical protein LCGC14_2679180, partial [marine sediment metagenome]